MSENKVVDYIDSVEWQPNEWAWTFIARASVARPGERAIDHRRVGFCAQLYASGPPEPVDAGWLEAVRLEASRLFDHKASGL